MKKIFIIFITIICISCLLGCKKRVTINFELYGKYYPVKITQGKAISNKIIPFYNEEDEFELFYDVRLMEKYNNEEINSNIAIYIKTRKHEQLCKEAKKMFYDTILKKRDPRYTIEDVCIHSYLGLYDDCFVAVFWSGGPLKAYVHSYTIEDLRFVFEDYLDIHAYYHGELYELAGVYNRGIISYDDLKEIYYRDLKGGRNRWW